MIEDINTSEQLIHSTVKPNTLEELLGQDYKKISNKIEKFISAYISKSSAKGLVIGLSGGLDSSVVLKLSVNALGRSNVLGLVMPSDITPREDTTHAIDLAKELRIRYHIIDIHPIVQKFEEVLPENKEARGNLMARIRMSILYYYAGVNRYLVAGTSDKSEVQIGYFSKFGDGAADIMPIAVLYKTQVRALARYLGVPAVIVQKKSSPRLWENHLAEEEIGMDYEMIDQILHLLVDKKISPRDVIRNLGVSTKHVNKVKGMIEKNLHKRRPAAIASL
ncbi:MAG: NAD+ synthase [Thermoproteota archaeon]|jgi:NAD+ synthase|nr:NAD+ synthase [Thermoproteota archaeon]